MKSSVFIATSLDGFIARENGAVDWLSGGDIDGSGEDYGFQKFMDSIDILVMGRNTYDTVLTFGQWPYGKKKIVVLSSKSIQIPSELAESVEVQSQSPDELVKMLSARGAKHLYVDGGKTIQSFLNAGLIQEIILTTIPILIGKGIPLFGPVEKDLKLHLVETHSFANGLVQSRYKVQY